MFVLLLRLMSNNGVFFLNLSILFISVTSPFNKFFGIIFCIILTKQKTPIVSKVKKTFVQKMQYHSLTI